MKNIYFLIFTLLTSIMSFGQGLEDFTNSNATSNYGTNSFVGNNGITWSYVASRDGNSDDNGSGITLPALMLRRSSNNSKITSSSITGGIGNFSVKLYKGFTGGGSRQVELFINGTSYGTSEAFDDYDEHVFTVLNINEPINSVIEIVNVTSKQVIIDDISWTGFSTSCGITLGTATYTCATSTIGDNNDNVTVNIPYTGVDATITNVLTTFGTVGGNNPAVTENGTITITGLSEGDNWDVSFQGGDCSVISSSGTVPADHCEPTQTTCFDLSNGTEKFEIFTNTENTNGDIWTLSSGTYNMNGYCGGGCAEPVNSWLLFGPLDMSGVTDLTLKFDAQENYGDTPLAVNYTANYSGCPDDTTWSLLQTITESDEGLVEVDLSSLSGTDVFISIQYLDDGADGYSDWNLSNVELVTYSNCPVLGTRPTSSCESLSTVNVTTNVFSVFPNPTNTGFVNITSASNEKINVIVFDMLGKQVLSNTISNNTLNVSTLHAGIYIVNINQNGQTATKKLVVK
ncbi:T9SS type A sorting domain-containing protein [Corallibacter sp.]|uniref:T9SS type A sorting domain-containing protein n=1 Tax=Corallibacter sp. TaxID=2038084 RepID=UPI003AB7EF48